MVENHALFVESVVAEFLHSHEVTARPSIQSARATVEREDFDVILVDYDLDDGKGDEIVRWLRAREFVGRVIAISAHDAGNEALLDAGADAVCAKLDFASIAALLRDVDQRRG